MAPLFFYLSLISGEGQLDFTGRGLKKGKEGKGIRERGIERESPEAISFLEGIALRPLAETLNARNEAASRSCTGRKRRK